ncbi:MAG: prepilin-type N-terminal cleavage/methylation domain-containing protein [Bryobacteraceae bacterium]|nr:prepilin-type N-terminal cleavage/methylation domain-containing protein [Bryobacteraceae bacterium]
MTGSRAGVTLVEMLVVVAIVGLMAGISFPAVTSGLETLRLNEASETTVAFLNAALTRADRRQQVMEITISAPARTITARSTEPGYVRTLSLPDGISIARVFPELPEPENERRFLLYPTGTVPRLGIELVNRRGVSRIVRVDPISGVPVLERTP